MGAITNVQDLLKTLEETSVAPPSKDEGAPQVATTVLSPRKEETPSHSELSKDVALVLPKTFVIPPPPFSHDLLYVQCGFSKNALRAT